MRAQGKSKIGQEQAIPRHLQNGQEFQISTADLIEFGQKLFTAAWTIQDGVGRPQTKGSGNPLVDPANQLVFPRNFNRISGPVANSCSGCHNKPAIGGGGDIVGNFFLKGPRFDFATFDRLDGVPTKGAVDELGNPVTLQSIANSRKTTGMFGSGFIEMLARQITADLQVIRNSIAPGTSGVLVSKGIGFGSLRRNLDGSWDTSSVEGIPASSLTSTGADDPPSMIIRPFQQNGNVISLRDFTVPTFIALHGIESDERLGLDVGADADGFANDLTRADVTAVTIFQATLPVPQQIIPDDPEIAEAVRVGQEKFISIGCASCHIPALSLDKQGWMFSEPNPYNPPGTLRVGDAPTLTVDLTSDALPGARLKPKDGLVMVPAFTDFKLHDITSGALDPNREPLDANQSGVSSLAGNGRFLTRKLWGIANQHPFGHHGLYTTMREAVLAHNGEALTSRQAFQTLSRYERDSVIEFLKSLQIVPAGTRKSIVPENGRQRSHKE